MIRHWGLIITHSAVFGGCLVGIVLFPQAFGFLTGLLLLNVVVARKSLFQASFTAMIIPGVYSLFSGLLLFFVDTVLQQFVFVALATLLFFLTLRTEYYITRFEAERVSRGALAAGTMGAQFLFFSSMQGFMINFTVPLWMFMGAYLVVVYLVSYAYYSLVRSEKRAALYSFVIAIVCVQLSWMLQFWPFGYLTTGASALIFYYILWDMLDRYAEGTLTRHHVIASTAFLMGLAFLVLATSRWTPLY